MLIRIAQTRSGSAPGPRWGLRPQTPAAARSAALRATSLAPFSSLERLASLAYKGIHANLGSPTYCTSSATGLIILMGVHQILTLSAVNFHKSNINFLSFLWPKQILMKIMDHYTKCQDTSRFISPRLLINRKVPV